MACEGEKKMTECEHMKIKLKAIRDILAGTILTSVDKLHIIGLIVNPKEIDYNEINISD